MSDPGVHEIVIIRRARHDGADDHHGGVWKIAFADFMTAMMAFFLVMWLISANDKTRSTIARYFNPVQLVDSTPQPQGLNDPKAGSPSIPPKTRKPLAENEQKTGAAAPGDAKSDPQPETPSQRDEAELFKDPYAVLAELAAKNSIAPVQQTAQARSEGAKGGAGAVGIRNGVAYRDPFEPLRLGSDTAAPAEDPTPSSEPASGRVERAATLPTEPVSHGAAQPAPDPNPAPASGKAGTSAAASSTGGPQASGQSAPQVAALRSKLAAVLSQSGAGATQPKLDVRRTEEGLLITLTDDARFSMFASASAKPQPQTVALMERIGRLLKSEKGAVTIRGFTDNHPFKSDTYDNWRLSSARAHMAHYMLVRGGLEEARFDRIEGYADRRPKNANDPGGAENRRIEILLRETSP